MGDLWFVGNKDTHGPVPSPSQAQEPPAAAEPWERPSQALREHTGDLVTGAGSGLGPPGLSHVCFGPISSVQMRTGLKSPHWAGVELGP